MYPVRVKSSIFDSIGPAREEIPPWGVKKEKPGLALF
jgi:hypothetical protein